MEEFEKRWNELLGVPETHVREWKYLNFSMITLFLRRLHPSRQQFQCDNGTENAWPSAMDWTCQILLANTFGGFDLRLDYCTDANHRVKRLTLIFRNKKKSLSPICEQINLTWLSSRNSLCVCCCRCAGACGGRSQPFDKKHDTCRRVFLGFFLILVATGLV